MFKNQHQQRSEIITGHIRVEFYLRVKTSHCAKPFKWKWVPLQDSFSWKSNSSSYERFCGKTRFKTEAQANSEMENIFRVIWMYDSEWHWKFLTNRNCTSQHHVSRGIFRYFLVRSSDCSNIRPLRHRQK